MLSIAWRTIRSDPVQASGRTVKLVGAQVDAALAAPWFGVAASYRFPVRAEIGEGAGAVPIRDHVMLIRVTAAALVAAATLVGRIRR
jgi:hypothetical protein